MSITILQGLPGAGKSSRLIELVNSAIAEGRHALTFVCSDFPWPSVHGAFWVHRRLVCRQPGLTCPLDHFVSAAEFGAILRRTDESSLIAIEEAYAFGPDIVSDWIEASRRGLELLIAVPSYQQMQLLKGYEYIEVKLKMNCQRCHNAEAVTPIIPPEGQTTLSICLNCFSEMAQEARHEIVDCLRQEHPFPGEEALYQPIELPELDGWRLARPDSEARVEIMTQICRDLGLPDGGSSGSSTYLDIGCNTGYFCHHIAALGFDSKGVDATKRFITVARLLDSFFRRQERPSKRFVSYERANAYEYLRDTQQERLDVTSAFAVFQWVMVQRSVDHGIACLEWLFAKTKQVCFLEMGYTREEMYKHQLPVEIDRTWVFDIMKEKGNFVDIQIFDGGSKTNLQRDLFVGFKVNPKDQSKSEPSALQVTTQSISGNK